MKKILLLDGVYPLNTRNRRIIKSLKKEYKVKYCTWNRESLNCSDQGNYIYSSNEGYGKKLKKLFGMIKYLKYIRKVNEEFKPDIIIASQWDMLLLVVLSNFKGKIIYENIDLPSSTNKIILKILLGVEKILLKKVDGIIFASRFFEELYKNYTGAKLVLENLPLKEIKIFENLEVKKREKIRISFIGTLRYFEVMKNLLLATQIYKNIEVYLIGKGPENDRFKKFIHDKNLKNITLIDIYKYEEIKKYYINTDLVWAVYPTKDYNVKYAISNKFFESLLFETPCFFSKDTLLGNLVNKEKIGFVINPYNLEEIQEKLNKINLEEINIIKRNIKNYKVGKKLYWEENEDKIIKFLKNFDRKEEKNIDKDILV